MLIQLTVHNASITKYLIRYLENFTCNIYNTELTALYVDEYKEHTKALQRILGIKNQRNITRDDKDYFIEAIKDSFDYYIDGEKPEYRDCFNDNLEVKIVRSIPDKNKTPEYVHYDTNRNLLLTYN